ncbi:BPSL0067 family protein [Phytobacter palmae]|uniref:BPSL0067 family protein n=1 Tax=Phytobacter palmae TaxID=1855371 RepID=A0ABU9V689_9ENTR
MTPGTAIATFDAYGRYGNHTDGRSHAAIYPGQDANGIQVLDQWMGHSTDKRGEKVITPHSVSQRTIRFTQQLRPENVGGNYYVVE